MKILIVEDDRTSAELLKRMAEEFGYTVLDIVSSGKAALESCKKKLPSLVLMDISLEGDLDGIDTAAQIRQDHGIPHIFITGNTEASVFQRANETLPSGYIIKPFNRIILKTTMDMAFYRYDVELQKKRVELKLLEHQNNLEKTIEERTGELKIFSYIAEQSHQSVVICNSDGEMVYVNNEIINLTGFDKDHYVGNHVCCSKHGIIPEQDVWNLILEKNVWNGQIYNSRKDNTLFYGRANVSSITDDKNNIHYIMVIDDITIEKQKKIEIEKSERLIQKSKIDDMDNELDWQKWKEKIKERTITRTDRSLFRNIYNSFNHGAGFGSILSLLDIVNTTSEIKDNKYLVDSDILQVIMQNTALAKNAFDLFSSIDWVLSHDLELQKITVAQLHQLIKLVANELNDFAKIKKHVIGVSSLDPGCDSIEVMVEKKFIQKALFELLLNALKFSRKGTIITVIIKVLKRDIIVSFMSEPDKQDSDKFIGIPEEYQQAIFEPFFRLSAYVYEEYKSLDFGLGLTMVEKIITKHNGEILAENLMDHSDLKKSPVVKVNISFKLPVAY